MDEKAKVLIEDISDRGEGIGRLGGKVIFVEGALPGEEPEVRITEDKGRYLKGRAEGAEKSLCGGAPLLRMPYGDQLRWKEKHVRETLKRLGGFEDLPMRPAVGCDDPFNYRNKGEFRVGDLRPLCSTACADCPIQSRKAMEVLADFREHPVKNAEELIVRTAEDGSVLAFTMQKSGYPLIFRGRNIINDRIGHLKVEVDAASFYQVNTRQCEKLYSIVKSYVREGDSVLDLYCGAGSIGLFCADKASRVIGVEVVKPAVVQANRNAVINGIVNATFICGKAEDVVRTKLQGVKADTVIVDPPRAGCKRSLLDTVSEIAPKRLIYVSCDPATLARDLKILTSQGFSVEEVTPVDMFPHTVHVETVVLMTRMTPENMMDGGSA